MDGKPPQQPCDVVEENVLPPEDDRRLEDRVGQPRRLERPLDERLAAEVRQRGIERGVRNADVHDAAYAGRPRGAKERVRVAGRHVVGEAALREPYPVRVEQRVDALQAPGQGPGIVEAVGLGLYPVPEGTGALRPARQRPHGGAAVQQPAGDVPARVPRCPCDDVCCRFGHGAADRALVPCAKSRGFRRSGRIDVGSREVVALEQEWLPFSVR